MFKWVHLVDAIAAIIRKVCSAICTIFHCTEHESEDNT